MKVMIAGGSVHKAEIVRRVMETMEKDGIDPGVVEIVGGASNGIEPIYETEYKRRVGLADGEAKQMLAAFMGLAGAGVPSWMVKNDTDYDPNRFSIEPTHGQEYIAARREVKKAKKALYGPSTAKKNKKRRGY